MLPSAHLDCEAVILSQNVPARHEFDLVAGPEAVVDVEGDELAVAALDDLYGGVQAFLV